jgi:hypothetical protein
MYKSAESDQKDPMAARNLTITVCTPSRLTTIAAAANATSRAADSPATP